MRCYTPFLFTFEEQPIKNQHVSDDEVHAQWEQHVIPVTGVPRAPAVPGPTDREEQLLRDVAAMPISPITQRYERLGWNAKTGNTIKDAVIRKGFARFENVSTPTARVKILSLTDDGASCLAARGVDVRRSRHGGAEHEYWKWVIRSRLEREGYSVLEEYPVGDGKTVDLRATRETEVVWVEVETGRSDILANIAKCGILPGRVVFVFTDAQTRDQYRDQVPGEALTTTDRL